MIWHHLIEYKAVQSHWGVRGTSKMKDPSDTHGLHLFLEGHSLAVVLGQPGRRTSHYQQSEVSAIVQHKCHPADAP